MDDFASAFMRAYQIGSMNRRDREERQATKGLADLIAKDAADTQAMTKDRLVDNPNYQFGQNSTNQAQSLNDLLPKVSLGQAAPTSAPAPAPAQSPQAGSQFSLSSLLPKAETPQPSPMNYVKAQPMQEFDYNKRNSLLAKGLELGVDYNTANAMVGNYEKGYTDQYNKVKDLYNWENFNNLQTPREKLAYAVKHKLPVESVKLLLSPDSKTELKQMPDGSMALVSTNLYTGAITNAATGQPFTADDLKAKVTPYQERVLGLTERGQDLTYSRLGATGGRYASPKLGKAEKWAESYELTQRIRDEETLQQYEEAAQGNMVDPKLQKSANEAAARMNQYWTISSGGEYGSGSEPAQQGTVLTPDQEMRQTIATMQQKGFSQQEIENRVRKYASKYGLNPEDYIQAAVTGAPEPSNPEADVYDTETGARAGSFLDKTRKQGLSWVAGSVRPDLYR